MTTPSTWEIGRARNDRLPACHAACPAGARAFGNLLDPDSEIRYVLEHKAVFHLKEKLGTEPKLWYFLIPEAGCVPAALPWRFPERDAARCPRVLDVDHR